MKSFTLKDLIKIKNGKDHKQLKNGTIPILGSGGLMRYGDKAIYEKESILLPRKGSISNIQFSNVPFWTVDTLYYTEVNTQLCNPFYLYNYLKILNLESLNSGTGVPSMTFDSYYNLAIELPSLAIQNTVSSILWNIEKKIQLNTKINDNLELLAKTLYDYWFVQFDFPVANGKPYKTSGGKMVWNEELKREIPLDWEVGTLSDIADLIRGVSYGKNDIKEQFDSNVIPILRATNLSGSVIDLDSMVYVPKDLVSLKQYLNKYEILITMSSGSIDHIGKNGLFYYDKEVAFGAFCAKLVAKNNFRFYLYSYTQSDFMFSTIKNECLGTNINNLNGSLVNGFKIIIPPKNSIDDFNKTVSSFYERIAINQKENQELASLRDWLLPMLMNGQVKVQD
jgi:type I restriction enzyme S subunit